jgi:hypothetical protein
MAAWVRVLLSFGFPLSSSILENAPAQTGRERAGLAIHQRQTHPLSTFAHIDAS